MDYDAIVVGSRFGGTFSAANLVRAHKRVVGATLSEELTAAGVGRSPVSRPRESGKLAE